MVYADNISKIFLLSVNLGLAEMISHRLVSLGQISILGIILRNKMKVCGNPA